MNDSELEARFGKIDTRFTELERVILTEGERTRRHFDVVAEDLKGQIKLIAEGHSALTDHINDVKGGIESLEAGQSQLDLRMLSLESRQGRVERVQKVVLTEIRVLTTTVEAQAPSRRSRRSRRS